MSKFFSFQNSNDNCYTTINIDKIVLINKKVGCLPKSLEVITQAQVLVEVGSVVKEYILDEDQYKRLMLSIKRY